MKIFELGNFKILDKFTRTYIRQVGLKNSIFDVRPRKCIALINICRLSNLSDSENVDTFLCDVNAVTTDPKAKTLCKGGDEGSPLLCKLPDSIKKPEDTNPMIQRSDYYVFGLAHIVSDKHDCHQPDKRQNVLFIYTIRSV